jgi:hypothetical protein
MRSALLLALLLFLARARAVDASPPDDDLPESWRLDRAFVEWSSWVRLGVGVERDAVETVPRGSVTPARHEHRTGLDWGLGIDATLPLPTRRVRIGPFAELGPRGLFGGGELTIAGRPLDMFWFTGERVVVVRAGSNGSQITGAVALGYRCPWSLWGPWDNTSRYMIGVRLVASGTRSIDDADDWGISLGLEFEPIGALRYVGGIRSWY